MTTTYMMQFLIGFCFGCVLLLIFAGYWIYLRMNRHNGDFAVQGASVLRDPDTWRSKQEAMEEKYGMLSDRVIFSNYADDISENAYVFDDSGVILLMGMPVEYKRIERVTMEFAGVYVIKVWIEGLEGHYLTLSSANAWAAHRLHEHLERIVKG